MEGRAVRAPLLPIALLAAMPAWAAPAPDAPASLADTQLRDPAKEAEARALMETIRCVVCQGQSVADSEAEIAGDMRSLIRERIRDGENAAQVRAWLIERYGDYITYDPPFSPATWALWLAPLVLLGVGVAVARTSFRRRR